MAHSPKLYTLNQIKQCLTEDTFQTIIQEIANGFALLSKNQVALAPVIHLGPFSTTANQLDDACIKSGFIQSQEHFVIKIATGGFKSPFDSCFGKIHFMDDNTFFEGEFWLGSPVSTPWPEETKSSQEPVGSGVLLHCRSNERMVEVVNKKFCYLLRGSDWNQRNLASIMTTMNETRKTLL